MHVTEVFSPPRFTARAKHFNLNAGLAMDLRTGWDLSNPRHKEAAWRYLKLVKPILNELDKNSDSVVSAMQGYA